MNNEIHQHVFQIIETKQKINHKNGSNLCGTKEFFKLVIYLQMHWFNVLYAIASIFLIIIANLNCVDTVQKAFYIWFIVGKTSMWRSVVFIVVLVLVLENSMQL